MSSPKSELSDAVTSSVAENTANHKQIIQRFPYISAPPVLRISPEVPA